MNECVVSVACCADDSEEFESVDSETSVDFRRISEAKVFVENNLLGIDHEPKDEKHTSAANHDDDVFSERQSSTDKFCLKIVRIHVWWWT